MLDSSNSTLFLFFKVLLFGFLYNLDYDKLLFSESNGAGFNWNILYYYKKIRLYYFQKLLNKVFILLLIY